MIKENEIMVRVYKDYLTTLKQMKYDLKPFNNLAKMGCRLAYGEILTTIQDKIDSACLGLESFDKKGNNNND